MAKVALVVGHSQKDQGARNSSFDMSEFRFNEKLSKDIAHRFFEHNMADDIGIVYRQNGLKTLPDEINALNPDLIVSLHANAFNSEVNGCEMLYYHKSTKGKGVARIFQNTIVNLLDNKDRGLKPCSSEDRGGYLLRYTKAPCVICEPFFIDNDTDYLNARSALDDGSLADTYCECIDKSLKYLKHGE